MNITASNTMHTCTSCGVCAAICPTEAISMQLDEQGFYRPQVDEAQCVDCSLCTKVCYKYNVVEEFPLAIHSEVQLLACQAKDENVVNSTTSGGVAHLLAQNLFEQGYKCVGVVYDNKMDYAKHICASSYLDIDAFRGSKYIQSMTFPAFKEMFATTKGEKVALFGTPCQLYAVDQYLKRRNRREDFLLIDIYCHGCPSLKIWQRYVQEIKAIIKRKRFDNVEFRSKIKGWGNFYVVVVVVDGLRAFVSSRKKDEFYQLFFSNLMLNGACKNCKLRSTLEFADIRLGDFWGKCYDTNTKGVSGVTLVTKHGIEAFEQIKDKVYVMEHPFSDFLPFQSWGKVYQYNENLRNHLFEMLNQGKALCEIQKYYFAHQSVAQKMKRHIKNLIYMFPPQVINKVKKIYHRL